MNFKLKIKDFLDAWRSRPRPSIRPRPSVPSIPTSPVPGSVINKLPINYILNDLSTPELVKSVSPPLPVSPPYFVKDYVGGGQPMGTKQFQSANCYVTITNTLNYYGRMTPLPLKKWAATSVLRVIPQAGQDLNAFYDRLSLQFFYFGNSKVGGMIYTANSSDIVSHELGHAILDGYRPQTYNAASLEVWSFHEVFGDFTAILDALSYDEVIAYVLKQTGGNLRTANVVSNLAEQVGQALYILTGDKVRNPNYLRSALNNFKYVDPSKLPSNAPDNQLAAEPHNFSRIFLGALYDLLVVVYDDLISKGKAPSVALAEARDAMARRILHTILNAPINTKFYDSIAKTLLWVERNSFTNTYYNKFLQILQQRQIVSPAVKILGISKCETPDRIVRISSTIRAKLGDYLLRIQADNPLYDVEVEIPHEQAHLYDENNNLMDIVGVSEEESLNDTQTMIEYLHRTRQVSNEPTTPFEISEGKLVRTHFE